MLENKLRFILTECEMKRIEICPKVLVIDLHGLTKIEMKRFLKNVSCVASGVSGFTLIHGYNHGTVLKESILYEKLFSKEYTVETSANNPGITRVLFCNN